MGKQVGFGALPMWPSRKTVQIIARALSVAVMVAGVGGCSSMRELGGGRGEVERMASLLEDIGRCDREAVDAAVTMLRVWAVRLPNPQMRLVFVGLAEALRAYCASRRGDDERRGLERDLAKLEQMLAELAASNATQEEQIRELKRRLRVQRAPARTCGEYRYWDEGACKDKRFEERR
jgi:hypothetical protein